MSTLNNNPKERIFAFDAAKAIGIFFIVIGHVFHDQGIYAQYVYSFSCSAVFFFLTGVTFFARQERILEVSDSKTTRLLVPFFIYLPQSAGAHMLFSVRLVIRGEGNRQQCSCHNHKHFKKDTAP